MSLVRHFLQETDCSQEELAELLETAARLKNQRGRLPTPTPLTGQTWGLLFSKSSTRTRVSFEVGLRELGAHVVYLEQKSLQIDRGEPIAHTAQVLSRYLHGLVIRCHGHEIVQEFAAHGSIPIVNGLTDFLHPCQVYSDLFTLAERWGRPGSLFQSLQGKRMAYFGDAGSNMAHSWILGAAMAGMHLTLAGPAQFPPNATAVNRLLQQHGLSPTWQFTTDAQEAARGADCLYTDVFVSMGKEEEKASRIAAMLPYQVSAPLLRLARPQALFLHCMPAHLEEEVSAEVFHGPQSVVFDQAENRLHMQKAILLKIAKHTT